MSTTLVSSHDWYDTSCCSGQDCRPVSCKELTFSNGKWFFRGMEFSGTMIKSSQDNSCHVCFGEIPDFTGLKDRSFKPYCVYIPGTS